MNKFDDLAKVHTCIPFEEVDVDPCMSFDEYFADRSPNTVRAHCATCEALRRSIMIMKHNIILKSSSYTRFRCRNGSKKKDLDPKG